MTNYNKGAIKERQTMLILKNKHSCTYVARVAGSHSEFDIIGISGDHIHLVQVKSTKNMPVKLLSILTRYKKDLEQIDTLALDENALKELWVFPPRKDCIKINVFPTEKYKRIP